MNQENSSLSARAREVLRSFGADPALIDARGLIFYDDACELVLAETRSDGRELFLIPAAANAWHRMKQTARADGTDIHLISAFRSFERQGELIAAKLQNGESIERALESVAPPGCSEHHTGRAVDIGAADCAPLDELLENTSEFAWLTARAREFGFTLSFPRDNSFGFKYEPWHWCYAR